MIAVLIKRGNLDTETHTGRTLHKDEGRDVGHGFASQGIHEIARKSPETWNQGGEAGNRFALRRN